MTTKTYSVKFTRGRESCEVFYEEELEARRNYTKLRAELWPGESVELLLRGGVILDSAHETGASA